MRVILLMKFPSNHIARSFPFDRLPDIGEQVEVVACDRPGQTFSAVVVAVDPRTHSYRARIDPLPE